MDKSFDNKLLRDKLKPIFDKVQQQVQYSDGAGVAKATKHLFHDYELRFMELCNKYGSPEKSQDYVSYGFTLSIETVMHYLECPDCSKKMDLIIQDIKEKQRRLEK